MKNFFIIMFVFGVTLAATSTVLAQDKDEAGSVEAADACRPLLTPEGAPPDTATCAETTGGLVAYYRGQTASDIDRFEKTAEAKKALKAAKKNGNSKDGEAKEGDR